MQARGPRRAQPKPNSKGPVKGGDKSFYSRFLSAISSPTEAPSTSQGGARTTRLRPLDEEDASSPTPSEGEERKAPDKAQPKAGPAAKAPQGPRSRSQTPARNLRLREYLALEDFTTSSSDDDERTAPKPPPKAKAAKAPDAKRGRGRPPTTGEYVGLADAKRKLLEVEREALQLQTEKEIVEQASAMATARATRSKTRGALASQAAPEARAEHAEGLQRQIAESLAVVAGVAKVSKGFEGHPPKSS